MLIVEGFLEVVGLQETLLGKVQGLGLQVEVAQVVHALCVLERGLCTLVTVQSLGECQDALVVLRDLAVADTQAMIDLSRLYSKTLGIVLRQLNHTIIINSRPLKLPLALLTMRHHQPPLDLYPRASNIVILVLKLIQIVLQLKCLVLFYHRNALIEL